jgi:hypothetical protein
MFKKRQEIDEIELGADLYLKSLKESKQALASKDTTVRTSQKPIAPLKNSSEDILEMAKEELKESKQASVKQNIMIKTPQQPASVHKERKTIESSVSSKVELRNSEDIIKRAKDLLAI